MADGGSITITTANETLDQQRAEALSGDLSAERMKQWMAADLSNLDLLIIQIDGIHIGEDLMLLAAVGIDGNGEKHPLGVIEGATENTARGAGAARQPGRAWPGGGGLPPVHHRRGQGTVQGDPQHLRLSQHEAN